MNSRSNPTVAVVDDDFRVRESIQSLIESAGYTALVFPTASAFLESGSLASAACLITDVRMPNIDGLALYRRVKEERPGLPVIFVSAHPDEETRQRALKQGAAAFLYKPFDAAELMATIEAALNKTSQDG
jgi:FixJ family two-component response regulator